MFQIIYSSDAATAFSPTQLVSLLTDARRRNEHHDVTGMLVFCRDRFLQALEGDATGVVGTFERIERDARHGNVRTLFRGHSPQGRVFGQWSMGFQNVAGAADIPPSFVSVSDRIDLSQFDHLMAIEFLRACQRQTNATLAH